MGYIKLFNNTVDYQDYISGDPLLPNVSLVDEDDVVYYNPLVDYSKEYMYLEALEDGMSVSFTKNATSGSLYYSLDKQEWNEMSGSQTINSGEKVYFKGDLVPKSTDYNSNGIGKFTINKQCNAAGNIMSLLFEDDFIGKNDLSGYDYAFKSLFNRCKTIKSAENLILPATTLADYCYTGIFYGCTGLTTTPALLPATTLSYQCYTSMFDECTSLITTPELPATTLAEKCYQLMFHNCTGLTTAPELPATTLANNCYNSMFNGCTSLTSAPELPATTLAEYCYNQMFYGCSKLTTAPELPATTLADNCYYGTFQYCTGLTSAPELPATTLANNCYQYMFRNCTSLTSAPELPASTLAPYCYQYMFRNCTNLNYIKMLATDISAMSCLSYWVSGVSPTGTFVKADGVKIPTGTSGIPSGWTVQVA